MDNDIQISSVILGSVLGFLATLVSAQVSSYFRLRSRRTSHRTNLKLEFEDVIKALDAIKTAYEHQGFYDFLLLDLLDKDVENLQDARKLTYLFRDEKLQGKVFSLINRTALLAKAMRGTQQYAYKDTRYDAASASEVPMSQSEREGRDKLVDEKRTSHSMDMVELKREVGELIELIDQ